MRIPRLFSPQTLILIFPVLIPLLGASCASLNSVSLTQVPLNRNKPIEASSWSWGIFGIYFGNGFVDETVDDLREKCPGGKISGVYTKYEGRFYLLWTTRTVTAKAFCENGGGRS